MITVRSNGSTYRFPDNTPQDVMKQVLDTHMQSLRGKSTPVRNEITPPAPDLYNQQFFRSGDKVINPEQLKEVPIINVPQEGGDSIDPTNQVPPQFRYDESIQADIINLQNDIARLKKAKSKAKTEKTVKRIDKEIISRQEQLTSEQAKLKGGDLNAT